MEDLELLDVRRCVLNAMRNEFRLDGDFRLGFDCLLPIQNRNMLHHVHANEIIDCVNILDRRRLPSLPWVVAWKHRLPLPADLEMPSLLYPLP